MSPAFSSTKHAGAFALLLLAVLLSPVIVGKSGLPPRDQIFSSSSFFGIGCNPYLRQQIYEEKSDVDIAFIGSSHIFTGIDTPYVQKQLSKKLGREAVVITLGYTGAGFDALYFITQDLLRNRRVKMIVANEEFRGFDRIHPMSPVWFRAGENAETVTGMPMRIKASFYFAAVQGIPRNLLGLLRSNLGANWSSAAIIKAKRDLPGENVMERLGSASHTMGCGHYPGHSDFVAFSPVPGARSSDVCIYSPETKASFEFSGMPTPPWALQFARETATLARDHQTQLAILNFPTTKEMRSQKIHEREFWPAAYATDVAMIGIPPAKLFAGIADEDVPKLFFSFDHFNKNGQEYFTRIITPSLLQIYDQAIH